VKQIWVGDLTYVATRAGCEYLPVLLNLVLRYADARATGTMFVKALPLKTYGALAQRKPSPRSLHHTDRGRQGASWEVGTALATHAMQCNTGRCSKCFDNAAAERFFATLELDLLATADPHSHREGPRAIAAFIGSWCDPERRHSTLGYVSPMQYRRQSCQIARV
jgi:putative transposase